MVSTRGHPTAFPEPELPPAASPTKSPSKRSVSPSKRSVSATLSSAANGAAHSATEYSNSLEKVINSKNTSPTRIPFARPIPLNPGLHTPPPLSILWLVISLPLVIWDTGYVLLRPYSMPGGKLHKPIWSPYELYGKVDHTYGWPAYNAGSGFTSAQGSMNLIETIGYIWYLSVVISRLQGVKQGDSKWMALLTGKHSGVKGAERAVTMCFAVCVMTVSKTVLYCKYPFHSLSYLLLLNSTNPSIDIGLNEGLSNPPLKGLRHNDFSTLFWIFIVPNILWIVVPTYSGWVLWREIVGGLERSWSKKLE